MRNDWPVGPPCGMTTVGTLRPPRLPVAVLRAPERALDAEAVACLDDDPLGGRDAGRAERRAEDGRHGIGDLARPARRPGRRPGRGAATGPGARSRARRSAATQAPSASQPTDSPDAVPRVDPAAGGGRRDGPRRLRWPAAAALRRGARGELADEQVLEPVVDLDVDEAAAVGRGQRRGADPTAWLAVLALAGGQHDPVVAVGGQADDLEPAVGIRHEQQRSVGKPAGTDVDAPLAGHDPGRAGRDVDDGDLRGLADVRPALGHDRDPARRRAPTRRRRRRRRSRSGRSGGAASARWPGGRGAGPGHRSARSASSRGGATGTPAGGRRATSAGRGRRPACRPRGSAGSRRPRRPRSRRRGRTRAGARRATTAGPRPVSPRRSAGPGSRRAATA